MRRSFVILLAVLMVLGSASFALWWVVVGRMEAGFAAFAEQARAQGWTVRAAGTQGGGWPFAADLVIADLSLAASAEVVPGGAVWRAEQAVLHLSPLAPDTLELRVPGIQRARAFGSEEAHFLATRFTLTTSLQHPGPVQLDASQIRFGAPLEGMTIGLLQAQMAADGGFAATAEAIALPPPPAPQPALGDHIASVTLQGVVRGPWPAESPDLAARAAAWQRGGGSVQAQRLAFGWGPLGVTGSFVLGLDEALQPAGTAALRVVGYDDALKALASGGALAPAAAQAIGAVLGLLARTPEGGGVPQVELPVALRDGGISIGHIPLGKLPILVWPSAP